MGLSQEERRALVERAAGLRAEVSSLLAERDDAVREASDARSDAKLMQEVASLEQVAESARNSRDVATGSVSDAAALMEAMARQEQVVADSDSTGESAPLPATDNTTPDTEVQEDLPVDLDDRPVTDVPNEGAEVK